jgi:ubiquinol-cytochrome c reductase iron-sulfur subunit
MSTSTTVNNAPAPAPEVDTTRRRNLIVGTAVVGGAFGAAAAWPFLASFAPSERAKAAGAPVEADLSKIEPGQMITVEWRGVPVWILNRTKAQIESLAKDTKLLADPNSKRSDQPANCTNDTRSIKPEYGVIVGICTHLGCSPGARLEAGDASGLGADWPGGFFCPCHGSKFDLAGRVFANMPAPTNLVIPPYKFLSDATVLIGEETKGA